MEKIKCVELPDTSQCRNRVPQDTNFAQVPSVPFLIQLSDLTFLTADRVLNVLPRLNKEIFHLKSLFKKKKVEEKRNYLGLFLYFHVNTKQASQSQANMKDHCFLISFKTQFNEFRDTSVGISQDGHMDSEREHLQVRWSPIWNTTWPASVLAILNFPLFLMFIFSLQCGLKAKAKYLHLSSRTLEMEKWQEWLNFISHPSLLPVSLNLFPFHYPQLKADKIAFFLFSFVMLSS